MPNKTDACERDRQARLAARDADWADVATDWRTRFAPGTQGCHEALHLASVFADQVDHYLAEHPAVLLNPRWYTLANHAVETLAELYQAIGAEHLRGERSE